MRRNLVLSTEFKEWVKATHPEVVEEWFAIEDLKESVREAEEGPRKSEAELQQEAFHRSLMQTGGISVQNCQIFPNNCGQNQLMNQQQQINAANQMQNAYRPSHMYGHVVEQQEPPKSESILGKLGRAASSIFK